MVVSQAPTRASNFGFTRIERSDGETQEQFDAGKGEAGFPVGARAHTLILDGKLDDVFCQGFDDAQETMITDLRKLSPYLASIRKACAESTDTGKAPSVSLGPAGTFVPIPNFGRRGNHATSFDLLGGRGSQNLNAILNFDGSLDLTVHTQDKQRELSHTMRANFRSDGTCAPKLETAFWHLAPPEV